MLDGKDGKYTVSLPEVGEEKRAILETYTKEHSAEYQSQALIDLAARMKSKIKTFDDIKEVMIRSQIREGHEIWRGFRRVLTFLTEPIDPANLMG